MTKSRLWRASTSCWGCALIVFCAASGCRSAVRAQQPIAPASVQLSARLADRLARRATKRETSAPGVEWDRAVQISMALRARSELLRSGVLSADVAREVRERAADAAQLVLRYEAAGSWRPATVAGMPAGARGWGTSKPIHIGELSYDAALDAYSTGIALGGLVDWCGFLLDRGEHAQLATLYPVLVAVADHWVEQRMFTVPGVGPAWEKIATSDPTIRRYVVNNTDAILARDLLLLARIGRALADRPRAARYERTASEVGLRIRRELIGPVVDGAGALHPERWRYGLQLKPGASAIAEQRIEDSNHGSFTLDFVAAAIERGLAGENGKPLFSVADAAALARVLPAAVFVSGPDRRPALRLYVDPAVVESAGRGKQKAAAFSFAAEGARNSVVTSFWKQLAGPERELDLGLSVRTCWGWTEVAAHDPDLLRQIGAYLDAAFTAERSALPANLFLAGAVWLRTTAARGALPTD